MSESAASPQWQMIIFCAAGLFLLLAIWRGWRAGVIRSGLQFGAIIAASVISLIAARIAAVPFGGFDQTAGSLVGLAVGAVTWLAVYIIVWILSAVLFKRTEQQGGGLFHFLWGIGGAFFGCLLGLILLWGCISVIRGLGAMAEAGERSTPIAPVYAPQTAGGQPVSPSRQRSPLADTLIKLKSSLELGPAGKVVETVDPIPSDVYLFIQQIGQLTGNQQAMVRFINYPDIQRLLQTPKMNQVLNDPSVVEAARKGNVLALISNKTLLQAVEDPAFAGELKKVDLRAALNFALESPTPSPAPSPSPAKKTK